MLCSICVLTKATFLMASLFAILAPFQILLPFISRPKKFCAGNRRAKPTAYSPRPQASSNIRGLLEALFFGLLLALISSISNEMG